MAIRKISILALCVCLLGVRADADPADQLNDEVSPFAESLLKQLHDKQFAELDALERQLALSKERFTGGDWKLYHFYEALSGGRISRVAAIEADWLEIIGLLKEWREQAPKSTVVSLLLANAHAGFGWFARGSGRAETVSDLRFNLFKNRLGEGAFYLTESQRMAGKNPQWFVTALLIARGAGWPKARAYALFEQAMAVEPLYQHTYSSMSSYLMPRWYGDEGEWEQFADEATARVGGQVGSAIYNHIIVTVSQPFNSKVFFDDNDLNWRRIQWSFADRERLYGAGRQALNALCSLAGGVHDKPTARAAMARIGDSWDQSVWSTRQRFDEYQQWLLVD